MKFRYGMPPAVTPVLTNPAPLNINYAKVHAIAIVIALVGILPAVVAPWGLLYGWTFMDGFVAYSADHNSLPALGMGLATILCHELIHMLTHPKFGFGKETYLGFLPQAGFYAAYNGVQSRRQILVTLAAPLAVLTVVPIIVSLYVSREWMQMLAVVSVFNALMASGDVWQIWFILRKLPRDVYLQGEYYGLAPQSV